MNRYHMRCHLTKDNNVALWTGIFIIKSIREKMESIVFRQTPEWKYSIIDQCQYSTKCMLVCKIYLLIFLLRYQKLGCHAWPYSFKFNAKPFLYELRLIGLLYTLSEKRVVNRALICFTHSQDIINAQILLIIHIT